MSACKDEPAQRAFVTELARISREVNDLLAHETLPETVVPAYLADAVRAYPWRGGKRLRPALVQWCCGLTGGNPARARFAALAVELYHNWTLVHDDIIDQDDTRRGEPSCHVFLAKACPAGAAASPAAGKFGSDMAILAGDIQHGWALDALCRAADDGASAAVVQALLRRACGWLTPTLIGGEALDVEFPLRTSVTEVEIERMMAAKTGALLRFAAESGAMLGLDCADVAEPRVARLGRFAEKAGIAFQLLDDLLGIYEESETMGKPACSDLREGKKTLLYTLGLARTTGTDQRFLRNALHRELTRRDIQRVRRILTACGAESQVRSRAEKLVRSAQRDLHGFPASRYRTLLTAWLAFVTQRRQ